MKKNYIIGIVAILLIGILMVVNPFKSNDGEIKFKVVSAEEVPEKIAEILPKYLLEERALTCKYEDEIYVVVTRGEKKSKGYTVELDKIVKEQYSKEIFDIVVYARFTDPDINQIVEQEYDYPYIVVKTNLKNMPEEVHLDIEFN